MRPAAVPAVLDGAVTGRLDGLATTLATTVAGSPTYCLGYQPKCLPQHRVERRHRLLRAVPRHRPPARPGRSSQRCHHGRTRVRRGVRRQPLARRVRRVAGHLGRGHLARRRQPRGLRRPGPGVGRGLRVVHERGPRARRAGGHAVGNARRGPGRWPQRDGVGLPGVDPGRLARRPRPDRRRAGVPRGPDDGLGDRPACRWKPTPDSATPRRVPDCSPPGRPEATSRASGRHRSRATRSAKDSQRRLRRTHREVLRLRGHRARRPPHSHHVRGRPVLPGVPRLRRGVAGGLGSDDEDQRQPGGDHRRGVR